jgi:hypothetical protein
MKAHTSLDKSETCPPTLILLVVSEIVGFVDPWADRIHCGLVQHVKEHDNLGRIRNRNINGFGERSFPQLRQMGIGIVCRLSVLVRTHWQGGLWVHLNDGLVKRAGLNVHPDTWFGRKLWGRRQRKGA